MPETLLQLDQVRAGYGDAVVLENRGQILGHVRLVAIAITGDEQRHLAARLVGGLDMGDLGDQLHRLRLAEKTNPTRGE